MADAVITGTYEIQRLPENAGFEISRSRRVPLLLAERAAEEILH